MKKWWLREDMGGDVFTTKLQATTQTGAMMEGQDIYDRLSKYDQKRRTEVCVMLAEADPDGGPDYDTLKAVLYIK